MRAAQACTTAYSDDHVGHCCPPQWLLYSVTPGNVPAVTASTICKLLLA